MSSLGLSIRTGARDVPDLHLVMHAVAIKKHAAPDAIASVAGLPAARVAAALAFGVAKGRLVEADGRYVLTPAGRLMLDGEYSRYYGELRADGRFSGGYERFEVGNRELKQLITDWQTVDIGGKPRCVAFVVPAGITPPSTEALRAAAAQRLASFKVPAHVWFVDALPTTSGPNGVKLQRRKLRDEALKRVADPG